MKRKVTKIKSDPDMLKRIQGYGIFRITGPHPKTGKRITVEFYGTRQEAHSYVITGDEQGAVT